MVCLSKYRSISKSTLFNEGGTKQWTDDRTVALRFQVELLIFQEPVEVGGGVEGAEGPEKARMVTNKNLNPHDPSQEIKPGLYWAEGKHFYHYVTTNTVDLKGLVDLVPITSFHFKFP